MSNKIYNVLKWVAIAFLPAIGALYGSLANIWGLPFGTEIPQTCDYIGVFLAVILGISNYNYYNRDFPVQIAEVLDNEAENDRAE